MSKYRFRPVASFSSVEIQVLDAIRLGLPQGKSLVYLARSPGFVKLARTVKRMADQMRTEEPRPKKVSYGERILAVLQSAPEPMTAQQIALATGLTRLQVTCGTNRLGRGKNKQVRCVGRGKHARWSATVRLASVTQLSERKVAVR